MFDDTEGTPAPKSKKARTPYKRTSLDDVLLVVRQANAKIQKLKTKELRLQALKMIGDAIEGDL